jgi:hypothetical protein
MKRCIFILGIVLAGSVLAQNVDVDPGVPVVAAPPASLDNPAAYVKLIFSSVKDGNWWAAASALLVALVSAFRKFGKTLHEKIPDNSVWDKPFWFILETKPGGWFLNIATAVAGGVGAALLAGEPVTWSLVKPILMVSVTGAALWEMAKDFIAWVKAKKADPAAPTDPAIPNP